MASGGSFQPAKQCVLSENDRTSFANWKSNIEYHLSLNNDFASFLNPSATWSKKSVTNRGLQSDGESVPSASCKTVAQKNMQLERMLCLIEQFSPSLLHNDIIKKSTSLNWIWQGIRNHYSFRQSEVDLSKLSTIKREDRERCETLFQ